MIEASPAIFERQLETLVQKSINEGNEFLFINAWNEWGEGMYLEPDMIDGYKYLGAVKNALKVSYSWEKTGEKEKAQETVKAEISALNDNVQKFKSLFELIDKWLLLEQENKVNFRRYFQNKSIHSVAVYGMAALGKHVLFQLRKEGIAPLFGIDRYVGQFGNDFKIYRPEEEFPEVDAVIITAYDTGTIHRQLKERCQGTIIALETMIDEMARW